MGSIAESLKKNRRNIKICVILLISFLMMRFIATISKFLFSDYPSFRIMMGLDIVFILLIPTLVIFISADTMRPRTSFFLAFIISGVVFPICDALFLDPILMLYPPFFIPFIIMGFGFGLVGFAGNNYHSDIKKSMIIFTMGMSIILINSASFVPIAYYVLTGDATILRLIPSTQ